MIHTSSTNYWHCRMSRYLLKMARGVTTFSKLGVQFLGTTLLLKKLEVYPVWCSRLLNIFTLYSSKSYVKSWGFVQILGRSGPPTPQWFRPWLLLTCIQTDRCECHSLLLGRVLHLWTTLSHTELATLSGFYSSLGTAELQNSSDICRRKNFGSVLLQRKDNQRSNVLFFLCDTV